MRVKVEVGLIFPVHTLEKSVPGSKWNCFSLLNEKQRFVSEQVNKNELFFRRVKSVHTDLNLYSQLCLISSGLCEENISCSSTLSLNEVIFVAFDFDSFEGCIS